MNRIYEGEEEEEEFVSSGDWRGQEELAVTRHRRRPVLDVGRGPPPLTLPLCDECYSRKLHEIISITVMLIEH